MKTMTNNDDDVDDIDDNDDNDDDVYEDDDDRAGEFLDGDAALGLHEYAPTALGVHLDFHDDDDDNFHSGFKFVRI